MSSRRIVQNVLVKSMRFTAQRQLTTASVVRPSILLNKAVFATPSAFNHVLFKRHLNSHAQESSIFKVVDYNDIQSIIKNEGKGYHLIDVREEKEVVQGAIPTAKNVPLSQFANAWNLSDNDFQAQFGFDKPAKESRVILYCLGGVRSTKAAEYLNSLGYDNLENYIGSWADYVEQQKKEGE